MTAPEEEVVNIVGPNQISFWCQGCERVHVLSLGQHHTWNENPVNPTIDPDMKYEFLSMLSDDDVETLRKGEPLDSTAALCHICVLDGEITYQDDTTHALRGQTLRMVVMPVPTPDTPQVGADPLPPS